MNPFLRQLYNDTYKSASARIGDDKMIRQEEWHDYIVPSSDRAGEIEAALAANGDSAEGLGELMATHPALAQLLGSAAGAATLGGATYALTGDADRNSRNVASTTASLAGALLGGLTTSAIAQDQQGKLIAKKVKAPDAAMKKKLVDKVDSGLPNVLPFAGGAAASLLPATAPVGVSLGLANRGTNAYAKKVLGDPLTVAERNPKKVALLETLLGLGLAGAVLHNYRNK